MSSQKAPDKVDIADEELLQIIRAFNSSQVSYMVVGGFAVNYYGYTRTTADFDLWIMPSNENKGKVLAAIESIGYTQEELHDLAQEDFTKPVVFQLGGNHFYIDIMTFLSGVQFDEAYSVAVEEKTATFESYKIIHRNHLIINKLLTGRPKDKLDVESLQAIQRKLEEGK